MTVTTRNPAGVKMFYGLAADTKPTSNVPVGSTFFVTDTSVLYLWEGANWVVYTSGGGGGGGGVVTQGGTWTVQPGNTANTTPWKVDGSAVTQPVQQAALRGAPTGGLISTAMTGTTSTIAGAVPTTGKSHYVSSIQLSNTGSVDTEVLLQDGSGGTTKAIIPCPAGGGAGKIGGVTIEFNDPIMMTINTAVYFANVTTGASVRGSWNGFEA